MEEQARKLIGKYFDGELNPEEMLEFEALLKNPQWAEEFERLKFAEGVIRAGSEKLYHDKLKIIHDHYGADLSLEQMDKAVRDIDSIDTKERDRFIAGVQAQARARRNKRLFIWIPAAAAVLAIALITGLHSFKKPLTYADLYTNYYQPYELLYPGVFRNNVDDRIRAGTAYKEGNFIAAVKISNRILQENPDDIDGLFISGLSLNRHGLFPACHRCL